MLLFTKRREQPQERPNNPDVGNQERIVTKVHLNFGGMVESPY